MLQIYVMKYIFNFNTKTDGNSLPDDENHKNFRIYDAADSNLKCNTRGFNE